MENHSSSFPFNSGYTTIGNTERMGWSQNSQSSVSGPLTSSSTSSDIPIHPYYYPALSHMPTPSQSLLLPYTFFPEHANLYLPPEYPFYPFSFGQNGNEMQMSSLLQPNELVDQERKIFDAYKTKLARSNRKMARQRSFSSKGSTCGAKSVPLETRGVSSGETSSNPQSKKITTTEDMYNFCTPDNKRLRELLRKDLQSSDVGDLKRIVLPKRAVEENLPPLSQKEGIDLLLRDVYSSNEWRVRFRFWTNNKSRMYVLENTGHFITENNMQAGDLLVLYEDMSKNLYFSVTKRARPVAKPSYEQKVKQVNKNQTYRTRDKEKASYEQMGSQFDETPYIPQPYQATDEESASLALFMNQLNPNKQPEENNNLAALPKDVGSFPCSIKEEANKSPPSSDGKIVDNYHLDDCYTDLGMLPDVNRYGFFFDDSASHVTKL